VAVRKSKETKKNKTDRKQARTRPANPAKTFRGPDKDQLARFLNSTLPEPHEKTIAEAAFRLVKGFKNFYSRFPLALIGMK